MNLLGKRTRKQSANVPAQTVPQADYDALKQQFDLAVELGNEMKVKIIDLEREVELLKKKIKELEEELDSPIIGQPGGTAMMQRKERNNAT